MSSLSKGLSKGLGVLALAGNLWWAGEAPAQTTTIDQLRSSKMLRLGYDADAPPFSYVAPGSPTGAAPQGYSIDLCRAVADKLKDQLKIPDLKVAYVPVDTANRFEAITGNKADLLCEAATATLSRRAIVDFSIAIFIDGASFAIRSDGPRDSKLLAGKKVAVLPSTTTEQELRRALAANQINAEVVLVKTNQEGLELLDKGSVVAYYADRSTLTFLLQREKQFGNLLLADTYLSIEPIALALRRGDGDFRLAVDTALSHIYRRGEIMPIFLTAFGPKSPPSAMLTALYQISALPD